jgi:DNA-binding transcriptional MerR regulator
MSAAQRARSNQPQAQQPAEARRPAPRRAEKSATAFRTISEVADDLEVPQHVLRFWETKFPQIRPMKRGGGRRYYRPEDIDLLRAIRDLLYEQGYTIKGVQKLMREGGLKIGEEGLVETPADPEAAGAEGAAGAVSLREIRGIAAELSELRDRLRKAIDGH